MAVGSQGLQFSAQGVGQNPFVVFQTLKANTYVTSLHNFCSCLALGYGTIHNQEPPPCQRLRLSQVELLYQASCKYNWEPT